MLNLSDNELDDLSREAAEKFEPAENAQSWSKLEQLLDHHLGKPTPIPKTIRPGTIFMYSGAILIVASVTYFLIKIKKNNLNSTLQTSTITNQKPSANDIARKDSKAVVLDNKNQTQRTADANDNHSDQKLSANNDSRAIASRKDQLRESSGNDKTINQSSSAKNNSGSDFKPVVYPNKIEKAASKITSDRGQERKKKTFVANNDNNGKKISHKLGNIKNEEENLNRTKENTAEKDISSSSLKGKNNKNNIDKVKSSDENSTSEKNLDRNGTMQKGFVSSGNQHRRSHAIGDEKNKNNDGVISKENTSGAANSIIDEQNDALKFAAIPGLEPAAIESASLVNDSALRLFKSTDKMTAIVNPSKHRSHGAFINQSLQIGILFAPEFSEVKHIYENNRIGNNLGLTLSYQFFSKVSINSGIIFSKKYYQSNDKGFHAPPGAVSSDLDIKFVNASANVIDIPLNIRYNYFSEDNSTFFVNGGFSSYLMSKQNLNLYCQPNNNNANNLALQHSGWIPDIEHQNKNYLFSILNLSAGFETSLGKNFSFQFEPYVKLPVKGVGYGKVNLSSYGINFSLKYAPVLKRGRR